MKKKLILAPVLYYNILNCYLHHHKHGITFFIFLMLRCIHTNVPRASISRSPKQWSICLPILRDTRIPWIYADTQAANKATITLDRKNLQAYPGTTLRIQENHICNCSTKTQLKVPSMHRIAHYKHM